MAIKCASPSTVMAPLGRYSHVVTVPPGMRLLVLAGQSGHAPDGSLPEGAAAQFENALTNVLRILASEGLGPESIIKLNSWFVEGVDPREFQTIRAGILRGHAPATTAAWVSRLWLPEMKLEVEAWAAAPP